MPYVNVIKFDIRNCSRDEISQFIRSNRDLLRHTVLLAEKSGDL